MNKLNLFDIPRFYQLVQLDIERFTINHSSAWYVYGVLGEQRQGEDDFYNRFPEAINILTTLFNNGSRTKEVPREVYAAFIEEEYVDDVQKHVEELCKTNGTL